MEVSIGRKCKMDLELMHNRERARIGEGEARLGGRQLAEYLEGSLAPKRANLHQLQVETSRSVEQPVQERDRHARAGGNIQQRERFVQNIVARHGDESLSLESVVDLRGKRMCRIRAVCQGLEGPRIVEERPRHRRELPVRPLCRAGFSFGAL